MSWFKSFPAEIIGPDVRSADAKEKVAGQGTVLHAEEAVAGRWRKRHGHDERSFRSFDGFALPVKDLNHRRIVAGNCRFREFKGKRSCLARQKIEILLVFNVFPGILS